MFTPQLGNSVDNKQSIFALIIRKLMQGGFCWRTSYFCVLTVVHEGLGGCLLSQGWFPYSRFGSFRVVPSLSQQPRQLKRPDTTVDFHMDVWSRLEVVRNVVVKTSPGADNMILGGNSYKMADAADLMAALQAFSLMLVILCRRRRQRQRQKHRFWVREESSLVGITHLRENSDSLIESTTSGEPIFYASQIRSSEISFKSDLNVTWKI